ncbi:synaptojanin-2-binding protein-like [Apostichopus japonicus]|uniref:synaptojanin-2-binding protein-like n=1 Tax=Stichopus japonicus TaxID=307972 RepID=UPI003AB90B91
MAETSVELEEEKIELLRGDKGLGFNIKGGIDQPHISTSEGIFVTKIREDGAAAVDGRLQKGDRILEINGTDVTRVQHSIAVDLFLSAGDKVVLVVRHGAEEAAQKEEDLQKGDAEKPLPGDEDDKSDGNKLFGAIGGIVVTVGVVLIAFYLWKRAN